MFIRRLVRVGLLAAFAGLVLPLTTAPASAAKPKPVEVTVMNRNLYLGADVRRAVELLPDTEAVGNLLWADVTETDFEARVLGLAAEVAATKPDVIGLQEAATWQCRTEFFAEPVIVYDFTKQLLSALDTAGLDYTAAATHDGLAMPALPGMNIVSPETFQPLFDQDMANCGFTTRDVVLVRSDHKVMRSGAASYEAREPFIRYFWYLDRGYAWADVKIGRATVRFVTTQLEDSWTPDRVTTGSLQAQQLAQDLRGTELPLVVMGDFANDPRDPRPAGEPNPGGQPEATGPCPAQTGTSPACNTYWTMVEAGFTDAGPDPTDSANNTWGSIANLAGPDPRRVQAALEMGNTAGWTDRLDYIFLRNGVTVTDATVIGASWPEGPHLWRCNGDDQVANSRAMSEYLFRAGFGRPIARGRCLPSDHAGVVATLSVKPIPDAATTTPTERTTRKVQWWWLPAAAAAAVVLLVTTVIVGISALVRRRRRRRHAKLQGSDTAHMG